MSNYSIGNSLTQDAGVAFTPGWHYHIRGGTTLPEIFNDPDDVGDSFDPDRWPAAFDATQYDYLSVQPYNTTSPDDDATPINSWVVEQPAATFVLHDSPASRDNFESQYHDTNDNWNSKQGQDARAARFKLDNPDVPLRETHANDALDFIFHDISNAPFLWEDMYRDNIHMSLDRGRFLLNNLMRAAFRVPFINAADFQALTGNSPDASSEEYLLTVANQFTPGFWSYTGGTTMIAHGYGNPGADYDIFAFNESGQVWSNVASAFVDWVDADFVDYRIAAIETGLSGRFEANIPDGTTSYDMRVRGGTLAESFAVWADVAVHGLTAGQAGQLDDIEAKTDTIGTESGKVNVRLPVTLRGEIPELVRNDDYPASLNRSLEWTFPASDFGNWSGGTAQFIARDIDGDGTIGPVGGAISNGGTESQKVTVEIANADLAVDPSQYQWRLKVTVSGLVITPIRGTTRVVPDIST